MTPEQIEKLALPFSPEELKYRVGQFSERTMKASVLTYIDARVVMDRLDDVVGPSRWRDTYRPSASSREGLLCRLEIFMELPDGTWQWVGKEDTADNTNMEGTKGGASDSFKRAAVKWGIGRYLYRLPAVWQKIEQGKWLPRGVNGCNVSGMVNGKRQHVGYVVAPKLPPFAFPKSTQKETPAESEVRRAKHDPEWENGGRERFMAQLADVSAEFGVSLTYDQVKGYLMANNKGKPSTRDAEERDALVKAIRDNEKLRTRVLNWKP